jgi:phosphoribosylaminoimidazolecarboxamide formyltransferase / IMP cyclohydrolase
MARRALLSVSDKEGITNFGRALAEQHGFEILSTGGTARVLRDAGISVTEVAEFTGSPELMDGRVKTLHPAVHGGILCRRDNPDDMTLIETGDVRPIDIVAVNLYPFRETVANPDVTLPEAVEQIDIGGPTMIRSAAKNHAWVAVVTNPGDYDRILDALAANDGEVPADIRADLAVEAFRHTASYDAAIDTFLSERIRKERVLHTSYGQGRQLRYGENPHQTPAFVFHSAKSTEPSVINSTILHGKEMSYNNYVDADSALRMVKDLTEFNAISVIKHSNPAGLATGKSQVDALERAWNGDPLRSTAMGSVIACTKPVNLATAEFLKGRFVEAMVAPDFEPDALDFLRNKSKDIRLLKIDALGTGTPDTIVSKTIIGGLLMQPPDNEVMAHWKVVTDSPFSSAVEALARFAYVAVKHTRSNAIILAREYRPGCYQLVGMGPGQPNRVDSLRALAAPKARANFEMEFDEKAPGGTKGQYVAEQFAQVVLASDAFFPFADTVNEANKFGIKFIVQPGGAKRDDEVIATANELGIAMAFTGQRHFIH